MGSFFLTNSKETKIREKALTFFKNKGMDEYKVIRLGKYDLFYFEKIYLRNKINHIFKKDDDYIIGIGTFFYKEKYGHQALEKIYYDFIENGNDIFNDVLGHFNFILYINNNLNIVTDKTGT